MVLLAVFLTITNFVVENSKVENQVYLMQLNEGSDPRLAAQDYCKDYGAEILELGNPERGGKTVKFKCHEER